MIYWADFILDLAMNIIFLAIQPLCFVETL